MTTKLTLSMNPKVVEKAKRISREKGISISRMVQDYFEKMESESDRKLKAARNLSGKLKNRVSDDFDWKNELAAAITKKHG